MKLAVKSFEISMPMALRFSSLKRHRRYLTSLEPNLIFKACSVTFLRMPGISEGFHMKMSLFMWRKLMSALSYLGESEALMCTTFPSKLLGSMRTSLVPSMGSKDSDDRLESSASSMVSS
jgi:hypothetical protein